MRQCFYSINITINEKRKVKELLNKENPEINYENGILSAKILGDIDHHCAKYVRERIDAAIFSYKPTMVSLDLSSVEFMDSSGLGLILGRYNTASEMGADFIISSPSTGVKKVLELAGIERIIKIEGDFAV